jgi:nucleobase:cation symporter-1, NCS1 family
MPPACFGLFIFSVVRAKGPGDLSLATDSVLNDKTRLAWAFLTAMNSAITGNFGPLITSEPDITRYSKKPRDQILGQALSAPFMNTLVALLGIISASASIKIYGSALWNPSVLLTTILNENNDAKTRTAVFFCSFCFMFSQLGTNVSANLIPFGCKYIWPCSFILFVSLG